MKKGKDSAGVARQWCGRLGKLENCQAGVFAASCRAERQIPIDGRLYLPKEWVENRQRCRQAGIPETEIVARSKAQHALAMVQQARAPTACASPGWDWMAGMARNRGCCGLCTRGRDLRGRHP